MIVFLSYSIKSSMIVADFISGSHGYRRNSDIGNLSPFLEPLLGKLANQNLCFKSKGVVGGYGLTVDKSYFTSSRLGLNVTHAHSQIDLPAFHLGTYEQ